MATITNNNEYTLVSGTSKADSIYNSGSNVTIDGGDGNDLITGFDETSTLKIGDGSDTYSTVKSGNNIIVSVGDGNITLRGAAKLDELNIAGKENDPTLLTLKNSSDAAVTLDAAIKTASAATRTRAIKITGNKLANTLLGGKNKDTLYGGNGNDYLAGNAGNDRLYGQNGADTLYGGAGNDTFIYSAGKDVITDFGDDDLLQITGTFSGTYNASKNTIAFKVGSTANALTLQNVTASGTFNINGDDYHISGTKLMRNA